MHRNVHRNAQKCEVNSRARSAKICFRIKNEVSGKGQHGNSKLCSNFRIPLKVEGCWGKLKSELLWYLFSSLSLYRTELHRVLFSPYVSLQPAQFVKYISWYQLVYPRHFYGLGYLYVKACFQGLIECFKGERDVIRSVSSVQIRVAHSPQGFPATTKSFCLYQPYLKAQYILKWFIVI